jgi:hypothetical protein
LRCRSAIVPAWRAAVEAVASRARQPTSPLHTPLDAMGPLRQVPMLHEVDREALPAEPLTLPAVAGTLLDHS